MKKNMFYGASPLIFARAKALRNNVTPTEMILWGYLRNEKGYRFRRQHPLGIYIADFYCHQLKLVIELDGSVHNIQENKLHDIERQKLIEAEGIKVIRFTNDEVMNQREKILTIINSLINV